MMFCLVCDVPLDRGQLRWAHAECAIALLPYKPSICLTNPAAGIAFQGSHDISEFLIRRKEQQDVNVIPRAPIANTRTP
jgi:hypothetical protein